MSEISEQPNIIVFFSDQQRWDTCGCYGQKSEVTPNLDRMASEGVKFEYAFTCQPVCGPARACLQTGKWATQTGCFRNGIALPTWEVTIADYLNSAGYETAYIGKWHLASTHGKGTKDVNYREAPVPFERRGGYKDFWLASDVLEFTSHSYDGYMFDINGEKRVFPEGKFRADVQTDWVLEYLDTRTGKKPFFMFISYIEPHHQNDHGHYEGPKGSKERFKDFIPPGDLIDMEGDWREEYPDYLGCCASLDNNLGRILDKIENMKIADNTIIIYISDHGSHFKTRNSEYKRSCHEGCIRIPMIIRGPGFSGGKVIDNNLVSLIDIPPTILNAAGLNIPEYFAGNPLQNLCSRNNSDWPDDVFLEISESHTGRAIRTKRWKYSVRAAVEEHEISSDFYVSDFLYDLDSDPFEKNNLANDPDYTEIREQLAERLKKRILQAENKVPEIKV